jgi:hypothetical protein
MMRRHHAFLLGSLAVLIAACARHTADDAALVQLRADVAALRDSAAVRFQADSLISTVMADTGMIAVGLRVATVRDLLSGTAARYLADVRLHLKLNEVVRDSGVVRTGIGPLRVTAGRWDLAVTIQRVEARMNATSINLVVTDSNRIDVSVPISVTPGSGEAQIDFRWDAATLTSVVCGDFEVSEKFSGYVIPRTYRMRGHFSLVTEDGTMIARPVVHDRVPVSPQPTAESWARLRAILNEQNKIFNCGIALSPSSMERMLGDLLTRGFRFRLPTTILRPVQLPASILNQVEVGGRRADITIEADPPRLTSDWLWLTAFVRATAQGEAPIRLDAGR